MKFINKGEPMKIRVGSLNENFHWITINTGQIMELPEDIARRNGLEEIRTTESTIGQVKIETKQIEKEIMEDYTPDDLFFKELKLINGIGSKTAKDIVTWGTKEKLLEYIQENKDLPFRDDIVKLLREKYG